MIRSGNALTEFFCLNYFSKMWVKAAAFWMPLAISGLPGKETLRRRWVCFAISSCRMGHRHCQGTASRLCRTLQAGQVTLLPDLLTQTVHGLLLGYLRVPKGREQWAINIIVTVWDHPFRILYLHCSKLGNSHHAHSFIINKVQFYSSEENF